jgi:two-component system, OmpR family, alkaline phosphatase synthesis response regulator PhoP
MSNLKTILIADDEADILEILSFNLSTEGYQIITANNGDSAIEKAKKQNPDLIILDMMMPGKTGVEVCEILRTQEAFATTIIVFLTAIKDESTEIKCFDAGADDYMVKPISPKVLVSKINALFRRLKKEGPAVLKINALEIDRERYNVKYGDKDIALARKEFELLWLLVSKPGKVFLRNDILTTIWGTDVIVGDRTIDVHIRKIRQKLGVDCISTVKGVGYKFEME